MSRSLCIAAATLLGTLAGLMLSRSRLSDVAKDGLAAVAGVAIAAAILMARAMVYFGAGGGEWGSFVGLDLPARPSILAVVVVATLVLLVTAHIVLTRTRAAAARWVARIRPAVCGTLAASVAGWLLLWGYWESR